MNMIYKKKGIPEEGEIVLCTVKSILVHSVFATLDEYDHLDGMLHISEVSPGRIRNLRDFVKEGKKIICKVLKSDKVKREVNLSLRRVSLAQRKNKIEELKLEQKAEKILEQTANKLKIKIETLYEEFANQLISEYGSLNYCFNALALEDSKEIQKFIPKNYLKELMELIKERIKPPEVTIKGNLYLNTDKPSGINKIKDAINKGINHGKEQGYEITFAYVSAPKYQLIVKSKDYKSAEKILQEVADIIINDFKKFGNAEFKRK